MQIYGIHPADKDLNFLKNVNIKLAEKYKSFFKYLRLEPDHKSHEECIRILRGVENGLVLFFCHALDKSLRGCKIEHTASVLSYKDFNYGSLISPDHNIDLFKNKSVFCLACNSKELGDSAINAGARVFLGFGDIPFYITENYKEEKIATLVKQELSSIVLNSLVYAIDKNYSFNELSNHLKIVFNQCYFQLLTDKGVGIKIRRDAARVLSLIKNGITLFGNGNELLVTKD